MRPANYCWRWKRKKRIPAVVGTDTEPAPLIGFGAPLTAVQLAVGPSEGLETRVYPPALADHEMVMVGPVSRTAVRRGPTTAMRRSCRALRAGMASATPGVAGGSGVSVSTNVPVESGLMFSKMT